MRLLSRIVLKPINSVKDMKALFLSLLLMTMSGIAYSQFYTLPAVYVDSMFFEVAKGRACDSLQAAQSTLIKSQGEQLLNQDSALKLAVSLSEAKEAEVKELRQALTKTEAKSKMELKDQKTKTRKITLIAIGQAVIIVLLIL